MLVFTIEAYGSVEQGADSTLAASARGHTTARAYAAIASDSNGVSEGAGRPRLWKEELGKEELGSEESGNGSSRTIRSIAQAETPAPPGSTRTRRTSRPRRGGHPHFDELIADRAHHASWDLRSPAQIERLVTRDGRPPGPRWEYDRVHDAARLTFPAGAPISLQTKDQLFMDFPALSPANSRVLAVQWEMRWGDEWKDRANNPGDPEESIKAIRLDYRARSGGDARVLEFQPNFTDVSTDLVGYPRIRAYDMRSGEPYFNSANPIRVRPGGSGTLNEQPGGLTAARYGERPFTLADRHRVGKPFLMAPEQWIRITWIWEYEGVRDNRLTMIASDEETNETVIFASVANPGQGMNISRVLNNDSGGDRLRAEFNRSKPGRARVDHRVWIRNVVVFKDKKIPHGGRPHP